MLDPLAEVIQLLQPRAVFSKPISGAGSWAVRYSRFDQPSFAAVLEGRCRLAVDGQRAVTLEASDFVLLPATPGFTMSSFEAAVPVQIDPKLMPSPSAEVRHGRRGGRPDVRLLGGYFAFSAPEQALLVSLLPGMFHVRGVERLTSLVQILADETRERRVGARARAHAPGRDLAHRSIARRAAPRCAAWAVARPLGSALAPRSEPDACAPRA